MVGPERNKPLKWSRKKSSHQKAIAVLAWSGFPSYADTTLEMRYRLVIYFEPGSLANDATRAGVLWQQHDRKLLDRNRCV